MKKMEGNCMNFLSVALNTISQSGFFTARGARRVRCFLLVQPLSDMRQFTVPWFDRTLAKNLSVVVVSEPDAAAATSMEDYQDRSARFQI